MENLNYIRINEKKTKNIRVGDTLDDLEPTTDKIAFKYTKKFNNDNKLKKIDEEGIQSFHNL